MDEVTLDRPAAIPAPSVGAGEKVSGTEAYLDLLREEIQAAGRSSRALWWGLNVSVVVGAIAAAPEVAEVLAQILSAPYTHWMLSSAARVENYARLAASGTVATLFLGNRAAALCCLRFRCRGR